MKDYRKEICEYIDKNWDETYIYNKQFLELLRSSNKICLFGAGGLGKSIAYVLKEIGIKVNFFCDNSEKLWNTEICLGIKCITVEYLIDLKKDTLVLVTTAYYKEICQQLKLLGFDRVYVAPEYLIRGKDYWKQANPTDLKEKACNTLEILEDNKSKEIFTRLIKNWFKPYTKFPFDYYKLKTDNQYFADGIMNLTDSEIFVDVGAYDGDTIIDFLSRTNNRFEKIIAYELDRTSFNKLEERVNALSGDIKERIILYNKGLLDKDGTIRYTSNATSSYINSDACEIGEVVRMSNHIKNQKVTFIKMDIEGAEPYALKGAVDIIKRDQPKLAICIYHHPSHLWEIPLFIKSLVPNYKIFIRHHTILEYETVCYAVL